MYSIDKEALYRRPKKMIAEEREREREIMDNKRMGEELYNGEKRSKRNMKKCHKYYKKS